MAGYFCSGALNQRAGHQICYTCLDARGGVSSVAASTSSLSPGDTADVEIKGAPKYYGVSLIGLQQPGLLIITILLRIDTHTHKECLQVNGRRGRFNLKKKEHLKYAQHETVGAGRVQQ